MCSILFGFGILLAQRINKTKYTVHNLNIDSTHTQRLEMSEQNVQSDQIVSVAIK